ncbi:MAG: hypothetical protein WD335_03635 [Candidatus Paceibacterota bacterium]
MSKENYKQHLNKKMVELPWLTEEKAIADRLNVSEEEAMAVDKFYQIYKRAEIDLTRATLGEYLEKIQQDVERGLVSPEGILKSGL